MVHSQCSPNIEVTTMELVKLGSVLSETQGAIGGNDGTSGTLG